MTDRAYSADDFDLILAPATQKHLQGQHAQETHGQRGPGSELEQKLTSNNYQSSDDPNRKQGAFFSERVAVENDGSAIMKKTERVKRRGETKVENEAGAYQLAKSLGMDDLVPPTVIRDHPEHGKVSLQSFVEDAKLPLQQVGWPHIRDNREFGNMAALDMLTANYDRHSGNFLIAPGGKLAAIDHGLAFDDLRKDQERIAKQGGDPKTILRDMGYMSARVHDHMRRYGNEEHYKAFLKKTPPKTEKVPVGRDLKPRIEAAIKGGALKDSLLSVGIDLEIVGAVERRAQLMVDNWDKWFVEE